MVAELQTQLDNTTLTEDEKRGAALFLACYARNAAELTVWLQMCGLLPYQAVLKRMCGIPRASQIKADAR